MCVCECYLYPQLSLSLKSFPSSLLKKYPKKYQRFEKVPKSEKRNDDSTPPAARALLFFSEKLPCTRRTETLPRVSKGCEKTSRTRIWLFCVRCSDPRFSFLPVLVFRPRAKIHKRLQSTFFCFPTQNIKSAKFAFFLACEAKKKTIARILLKLPHANDKNAMRLSIRTGE